MERKDMLARLEAGYSAMDVALEKWNELKKKWVKMTGREHCETCALCYILPTESYRCVDCVLVRSGGIMCDNSDSPYHGAVEKERPQIMIDELLRAKEWQREQDCKGKKKEVKEPVDPVLESLEKWHKTYGNNTIVDDPTPYDYEVLANVSIFYDEECESLLAIAKEYNLGLSFTIIDGKLYAGFDKK